MKNFRNLLVWQKGHALTLAAYGITASFPKHELYGLCSQIRRASASIPTNIAEGCGRKGNNEFHRFLQIAAGSASELEYELLLARDLNYVSSSDYARLDRSVCEVKRMLASLLNKVDVDRQAEC